MALKNIDDDLEIENACETSLNRSSAFTLSRQFSPSGASRQMRNKCSSFSSGINRMSVSFFVFFLPVL
jgi:hypothetical protein